MASGEKEVRIQVLSDTHLEFPLAHRNWPTLLLDQYGENEWPVTAQVLALVGDVSSPGRKEMADLLIDMGKRYSNGLVFYVPGNHEYYSTRRYRCTYESAQEAMRQQCDEAGANVHFGYKCSVLYEGVRFLATTLWSRVPDDAAAEVGKSLSDYSAIYVRSGEAQQDSASRRHITVADTNAWFDDELTWLTGEITKAKDRDETVVVLTHHAPTFHNTASPQHQNSPIQSAFATDLEHLLRPPVRAWVFGHTHYNHPTYHNDVLVTSNQVGYFARGERSSTFDPRYTILCCGHDKVKELR
mmetsp:Transcript_18088/g.51032  ORF Transcript_18088/g.51032 Transcript_18088/m.51032 type:complete len:299 (-) Transcript_18088:256-1152(-)